MIQKKNEDGFTLVEVIVTILIIGILTTTVATSVIGFIEYAQKKRYLIEAQNVYQTANLYLVMETQGEFIDEITFYEDMTIRSITSDKHPLAEYLMVNPSSGAKITGITLDTEKSELLSMTYEVGNYVVTLEKGEETQIEKQE